MAPAPSRPPRLSLDARYIEIKTVPKRSEDIIAGYEFKGRLGNGTSAVVHRAISKKDGRYVAMKCIQDPDEEQRAFAQEEHQLLQELRHPNIIKAEAIFETARWIFVVLEYCDMGCVDTVVRENGKFSEDKARPLVLQCLQGVSYLHGKRIVHRDIKPANLLLRKSSLKISDFNSAKRIGGNMSCAMLTDRGTRCFSAPELRFGHIWNERIDVWSCGLCFHFMLEARLAFNIMKERTALMLLQGRLPQIAWHDISRLMVNLVEQCLTINMRDRPPCMELLMHPVFAGQLASRWYRPDDSGRDVSRICSVGRAPEIFAWRPTCGLIALSHPAHEAAEELEADSEKDDVKAPAIATRMLRRRRRHQTHGTDVFKALQVSPIKEKNPSCWWLEGRSGLDVLARLAEKRCNRMHELNQHADNEIGRGFGEAGKILGPADSPFLRKFFSTHGGTSVEVAPMYSSEKSVGCADEKGAPPCAAQATTLKAE